MSHDLDRRGNWLARASSWPVMLSGASVAIAIYVAVLAKPITIQVGDIDVGDVTLSVLPISVRVLSSEPAVGSGFMLFLPGPWTTTVIEDPMSTLAGTQTNGTSRLQTIGIWSHQDWGHAAFLGGRLTAHADGFVRDSFTVAGQKSPPYWWESVYPSTLPGGQGPDQWEETFPGVTRLYLELVTLFEKAGVSGGAQDFLFNCNSTKYLEVYGSNYHIRLDIHGGSTSSNPTSCAFTITNPAGTITDPVTGCQFHGLVANKWKDIHPGDTITGISLPCQNKGRFQPVLGVPEAIWLCIDASQATTTFSFGKNDELAGAHVGLPPMGSITGLKVISTHGGGTVVHPTQSRYVDNVTGMTGSSGTCALTN